MEIKTKKCSICYEVKKIEEFYFSKEKYDTRCKECLKTEQRKQYHYKHYGHIKKQQDEYETQPGEAECIKCLKIKQKKDFYIGHFFRKSPICKQCCKAYQKEIYYNNNPNAKRHKDLVTEEKKRKLAMKESRKKKREEKNQILEQARAFKNSDQKKWAIATRNRHREKYVIRITSDELAKMAFKATHCPLCDIELNYERNRGGVYPDTPSWDRIDNNVIMNAETTQILCCACNGAKGIKPMKQFIAYCTKIANKYKGEI